MDHGVHIGALVYRVPGPMRNHAALYSGGIYHLLQP